MSRPASPSGSRKWSIALRVVVVVLLLALAIRSNRSQIADVLSRKPHIGYLCAAIGLYLVGLIVSYVRWYWLVRAADVPFRFRDALRLGFIGALFNFIIPGAIAGVFVRAAYLCREQPKWRSPAIASSFTDLILGLLGLLSLACAAGAGSWSTLSRPSRRLVFAAWILTAVFGLLLAVAFSPALYRPLSRLANRRKRLARLIAELVVSGATYRRKPFIIPIGVTLGAATHSLNVLAFWLVGHALFPTAPSLGDHFRIVPLVLFSTAIPLPFGALGASEGVSLLLFRSVQYAGGGVAMMGFRLLQIVGASIGMGVYLANLTQMRALRAEAQELVEETDLATLGVAESSRYNDEVDRPL
jgi:glycosyltransferase 2 family protein